MSTVLQVMILMSSMVFGSLASVAPPPPDDCPRPVASTKLLTFLSIFNGQFQPDDDVSDPDLRATQRSVNVPVLDPAFSIYVRTELNGQQIDNQLLAVQEDVDGLIQVQIYNFTQPPNVGDDFDPINDFAELRSSDLTTIDDCKLVLEQTKDAVFNGYWINCNTTPFQRYDITVKCNTFKRVESEKPKGRSRIQTNVDKIGASFPLLDFMLEGNESFESPCGPPCRV